jgi:hypothetical protein
LQFEINITITYSSLTPSFILKIKLISGGIDITKQKYMERNEKKFILSRDNNEEKQINIQIYRNVNKTNFILFFFLKKKYKFIKSN